MGADRGPPDCPQNNIGLVLHGVMECDLSLRFLENALAVSTKYTMGPSPSRWPSGEAVLG